MNNLFIFMYTRFLKKNAIPNITDHDGSHGRIKFYSRNTWYSKK